MCLFDSRTIFFGNPFLSKNTILSTSLSNITFLSASLSIFLSAFSVERFLSAFLSTFLSAFFVQRFFECFFEHSKKHSRYFGTLFLKTSISVPSKILVARMKALLLGISCNFLQNWIVGHSPESELLTFNMRHSNIVRLSHVNLLEQTVLNIL